MSEPVPDATHRKERSDLLTLFTSRVLPISSRRMYLITFQPYQKGKSYHRWSESCSPYSDFLKKFTTYYFIVRELCQSGKPHFHALVLVQPKHIPKILKCRYASVDSQKTKTKLFKFTHPWSGVINPDTLVEFSPPGYDPKYQYLHLFNMKHVCKVARTKWLLSLQHARHLNKTWATHPYLADYNRIISYLLKDDPHHRYFDYYVSTC